MKLKEGYLVKEIADSYALFPIGQNVVDYRSIFSTNSTGKFILDKLSEEISFEALTNAVYGEYAEDEADKKQLEADLNQFLNSLREKSLLCE